MRSLVFVLLAAALWGCGSKEVTSADVKAPDPYKEMAPAQKVDAIRSATGVSDMQKHQMISDAQQAAGQPVTGQ